MPLTRKLLRELNLPPEATERILSAYRESTDALRRERNEAHKRLVSQSEEVTRIQQEMTAFQARIETERLVKSRQESLRTALLEAGANPEALPLLASAVPPDGDAWDGDRLRNPAEALAPLISQYSGLFAKSVAVPTPRLSPPVAVRGPMTREDVGRMSEAEIIANWPAVQSALRGL